MIDKWSKIVGEQLYTPDQQHYLDRKKELLEHLVNRSEEERKFYLERFEYDWVHRKEEAEDRKRRRQ